MALALSRSPQTSSHHMASWDVLFLALALISVSLGTFFFFQACLADVVMQGLDNTSLWTISVYGSAETLVIVAGGLLTLAFIMEANRRNQGTLLLLALLSFVWMTTPLFSSSTKEVLMGRTKVLSLLTNIRKQGSVSSEEPYLLAALQHNDEAAINRATSFTRPSETQELISLAGILGMSSQPFQDQGFATIEQTQEVLDMARSQRAPLHTLNRISVIQSSQHQQSLGWKQLHQERGGVQ